MSALKPTPAEIAKILAEHKKWLTGDGGSRANLSGADLSGANLSRADLSGASLSGANLSRANLYGANLYGAIGCPPNLVTPLLMLLDQPGKIHAYKLVNAEDEGHCRGGIKYPVGAHIEVPNANTDASVDCGAGVNVATLDWCLREYQDGYSVRIVAFMAADIAAIPTGTDGKFRLHRCDVVGEKDVTEIVKAMRGGK